MYWYSCKYRKNSELGKIALSLNEIDRIETPLQLKIKELSKKITLIVFVILIFIFILALINKYTILEIIMLCSSLQLLLFLRDYQL